MKNTILFGLILSVLFYVGSVSAAWNYGMKVRNIDIHPNGNIYVNFDKVVSPACTDQYWVVFQSGLGDKMLDRMLSVFLSAYVSGKSVGVETTGNCVGNTTEANRVQFTE